MVSVFVDIPPYLSYLADFGSRNCGSDHIALSSFKLAGGGAPHLANPLSQVELSEGFLRARVWLVHVRVVKQIYLVVPRSGILRGHTPFVN